MAVCWRSILVEILLLKYPTVWPYLLYFWIRIAVWVTSMRRVLILVGQEFEDIEVLYPLYRFKEEGFEVHIASYQKEVAGKHGYRVRCDILI